MRPLTRAGLGLLALAAPATAIAGPAADIVARQMAPARAGTASAATPTAPVAFGDPAARGATICPSCLQKASESNGRIPLPPSGVQIGAVCSACQVEAQIAEERAAEGGQPAATPTRPPVARAAGPAQFPAGAVFGNEGAPAGYAVVGGRPAMVASNGMAAPGYAVAGGQPAPAVGPVGEPSPIGVVQAGYRSGVGMAPAPFPGTAQAPLAATGRPGASAAGAPALWSSSLAPFAGPPPKRGPNFLSHLFYNIPGVGRRAQEAHERRTREAHAMISYGPNGQAPTDLPAGMVYGR